MRRAGRWRGAAVLVVLALAVVAAACGGDDGDGEAAPPGDSGARAIEEVADVGVDQLRPAGTQSEIRAEDSTLIVSPFPDDTTLFSIQTRDGVLFRFAGTRGADGRAAEIDEVAIVLGEAQATVSLGPDGRVSRVELFDGASAEGGAITFTYREDAIVMAFFASAEAETPGGTIEVDLVGNPAVAEALEQLSVAALSQRAGGGQRLVSLGGDDGAGPAPAASVRQSGPTLSLETTIRQADGALVTAGLQVEWQIVQPAAPIPRVFLPTVTRRGPMTPSGEPGVFEASIPLVLPQSAAEVQASCEAAGDSAQRSFWGLNVVSVGFAALAYGSGATPPSLAAGATGVALKLLSIPYVAESFGSHVAKCATLGEEVAFQEGVADWTVRSIILESDRAVKGFEADLFGSRHPDVGRGSVDEAFASSETSRGGDFGDDFLWTNEIRLSPDLRIDVAVDAEAPVLDETVTVSLTVSGGFGAYTWIWAGGGYRVGESPTGVGAGGNAASGGSATAQYVFEETGRFVLVFFLRDGWGTVVEKTLVVDVGGAGLSLSLTVDEESPGETDVVTYTLRVRNNTADPVSNVTVTNQLPDAVTYLSAEGDGTYISVSGLWIVGDLAVGATAVQRITVQVAQGTDGQQVRNAVSAFVADGTDQDSDAAATFVVNGAPLPLRIRVDADRAEAAVGEAVQYTLTVRSNGTSAVHNLVIVNPLPAGVSYQEQAGSGRYDAVRGRWAIGTLEVDAEVRLTITVTVDAGSEGQTIVNVVESLEIGALELPLSAQSGLQASVRVIETSGEIIVTVSSDRRFSEEGQGFNLTLAVSNTGGDFAPAVEVVFPFPSTPSGLVYAASSGAGTYDLASGVWEVGGLAAGASATRVFAIGTPPGTAGSSVLLEVTMLRVGGRQLSVVVQPVVVGILMPGEEEPPEVAAPPRIASISPDTMAAGVQGTVTVLGEDLAGVVTARIVSSQTGVSEPDVVRLDVIDATTLELFVSTPAASEFAPGVVRREYELVVCAGGSADGEQCASILFVVSPIFVATVAPEEAPGDPVITSISPNPVVAEPGTTQVTLTITGENFADDAVVLGFPGVAVITSQSPTTITVIVSVEGCRSGGECSLDAFLGAVLTPANGPYGVSVSNPGGTTSAVVQLVIL